MSNITNLGGVTMNKEIFEYGGHHFIPERQFTREEDDFFVISRRQRRDKEPAFVSQAMVMRASILILLRTSMLCHRKRSVTCSAVWKTESYICLVKMIYRSMWRQRNVNYQNQHDRKSE